MRYSVMMIRGAVTPICTRYYGEREATSLRHLYLFLCCHRWCDLADRRKMTRLCNATWRQARYGWMIRRSHTALWNVIQEILLSVGIERSKTRLPNIISSDCFRSPFRLVGTGTLSTLYFNYRGLEICVNISSFVCGIQCRNCLSNMKTTAAALCYRHPLFERNGLALTTVATRPLDVSHRWGWRTTVSNGSIYNITACFQKMLKENWDHSAHCVKFDKWIALVSR